MIYLSVSMTSVEYTDLRAAIVLDTIPCDRIRAGLTTSNGSIFIGVSLGMEAIHTVCESLLQLDEVPDHCRNNNITTESTDLLIECESFYVNAMQSCTRNEKDGGGTAYIGEYMIENRAYKGFISGSAHIGYRIEESNLHVTYIDIINADINSGIALELI